ncbi:RHOMBOID-like protein 9, chloroplastic isoform X2 [Cucurbita pepo subsp. pepo]|uniref:RHOMBOID-like protein 9, chloroplastic isoform X2 n=1 Tax=Cucurbita pepo subsp. pepo TaxID=3664 RepID=UPI000C9D4651|nr:RHOMBOID-like protein 9, chloroplastic isoform X2 [Cucurbita pepo subsp. pepo]
MMALVIPAARPIPNLKNSINPITLPILERRNHWREISNNNTSVAMVWTRTTKPRRGSLTASLQDDKRGRSNGLDSESEVFEQLCRVRECDTNKKQLRSLGSYFGRLQGGGSKRKMVPLKKKVEVVDTDACMLNHATYNFGGQHKRKSVVFTSFPLEDHERDDETQMRHDKLDDMIKRSMSRTTQLQEDEVSDLYLISALVSVNIGVFLFEVASPVKSSGLPLFSLPSLYGAKINELILVGEWWRLVTPMFLHSGAVHVALSCWTLVTFGRQVCIDYGPFTFFLIYVLGGISGNLTSFLHTPEPTIGGTGPVFAMIGAWLSYQFQSKDVVAKDVSDSMFLKAIFVAVVSSILSNIGPIDEWTHTGAAFSGMLYGILTCPVVEVNDAGSSSSSASSSSRRGQEKGIKLVRKYADPRKSLAFFALFIMGFTSLLFFIQPPATTLPL